jgi:hypothetical protein
MGEDKPKRERERARARQVVPDGDECLSVPGQREANKVEREREREGEEICGSTEEVLLFSCPFENALSANALLRVDFEFPKKRASVKRGRRRVERATAKRA